MTRRMLTTITSNWSTYVEGMQQSADAFYKQVEAKIARHQLKGVTLERVSFSEGGIFSANREYLQVRRGDHVFHLCAAPYGDGFFVSWWCGLSEGIIKEWLKRLPLIGHFIAPVTYYTIDLSNMFSSIASGAVKETLTGVVEAQNLKALSIEAERPVMRQLAYG